MINIVFAGTPEFAKNILASLLVNNKITIQAVLTQADKPKGRGLQRLACPTKILAQTHDLPVYQYLNLKSPESQAAVHSLPWSQIDLLITAAYGLILPPYLLSLPKYGCWNVHASLLPRWRGASPIQQAILAGDPTTGVTLMQMAEGLDDGDILWQKACPIEPEDTYASLEQKLAHIGACLLTGALTDFMAKPDCLRPLKQESSLVTHAPKIDKSEAHLDWSLPAVQLERKIRAFTPAPGCFSFYQGQRIKIWGAQVLKEKASHLPGTLVALSKDGLSIQAGEGSVLRLTHIQLPGKNKLPFHSILLGYPDFFTLHNELS